MLKKITLFFCAIIIICGKVYAYEPPGEVKIGLHYGSSAPASVTVYCAGGINVGTSPGAIAFSAKNATAVTVRKGSGSSVEAVQGGKVVASGAELHLIAVEGSVSVNDKPYRGRIIIRRYEGGNLTVINQVPLEDYVAGVVPGEMWHESNMEALKAQAVCARNYVVSKLGRHKSYGFDVCASVCCQVYGGISAETERTNLAVFETTGVIALYEGQPAELYFAASTGGYTEDVANVWGTAIPYLKAVPSEYENESAPYYNWTFVISPDRASEVLAKYDIGRVSDIVVEQQSQYGAVTKLKVIGSNGEKTFTLESARTVFGYDGLKSQAYTVSRGAPISVTAIGSDGKKQVDASSTAIVYSDANVEKRRVNINPFSAVSRDGVAKVGGTNGNGDFVFVGRGWGHLVGMSQHGAMAMGDAGFTYDEILTHYFTGIEL